MNRVVFVLADLFAAHVGELGDALLTADVPGISDLEWALAHGNRSAQAGGTTEGIAGWRDWLCTEVGAVATVTAPGRRWLATPVHYVAGLDTIRLHPDGLIRLDPDEQQLLAEDFARVFSNSGWQLQPTSAREMLLQGPPLAVNAPDPARFLGLATGAGQLRGQDSSTMRRLQSEIEMWLHAHPLNLARGIKRRPVNGLWLWGPQYLQAVSSPSTGVSSAGQLWQLLGEDLAARSIVEQAGGRAGLLPTGWDLWLAGHNPIADDHNLIIVLSLAGEAPLSKMQALMRDWMRPALQSWRGGEFAILEILCANQHWLLNRAARWRFWRRRAHWLESLLAC